MQAGARTVTNRTATHLGETIPYPGELGGELPFGIGRRMGIGHLDLTALLCQNGYLAIELLDLGHGSQPGDLVFPATSHLLLGTAFLGLAGNVLVDGRLLKTGLLRVVVPNRHQAIIERPVEGGLLLIQPGLEQTEFCVGLCLEDGQARCTIVLGFRAFLDAAPTTPFTAREHAGHALHVFCRRARISRSRSGRSWPRRACLGRIEDACRQGIDLGTRLGRIFTHGFADRLETPDIEACQRGELRGHATDLGAHRLEDVGDIHAEDENCLQGGFKGAAENGCEAGRFSLAFADGVGDDPQGGQQLSGKRYAQS